MVAGTPGIDLPGKGAALSVLPLGADLALTSRVRRLTDGHPVISVPRDGWGAPVRLVTRDLVTLSWQADDGLRSVRAEVVELTHDDLWRIKVRGEATKVQRRDAVRAPIGLPVLLSWGAVELIGSTMDLSEGGCSCVFRPHAGLGGPLPLPMEGEGMTVTLDLYTDVVQLRAELLRRAPRRGALIEWSLAFVQVPERTCDLIRSHVFTALRSARARTLGALY